MLIEHCRLEWDKRRGVLYVHNDDNGTTVLRVQGLPPVREDSVADPSETWNN